MLTHTVDSLMARVNEERIRAYNLKECRGVATEKRWYGATVKEIQEWAITGWSGGADKLHSLPGFDAPNEYSAWKREWSDADGDYWDMDRYYDERPFLSRRVRKAQGGRRGSQATLLVNIGERCFVNPDQMIWKAFTAVKVVDELEAQGKRVTVYVGRKTVNVDASLPVLEERVLVKEPDEPVSLSRLANWCSPWAFRYWLMGRIRTEYPRHNKSMGWSGRMERDEAEPTFMLINHQECLSEAGAKKWLEDIGRKDG